jgi:isohexenylglutaconyl-CoA hydratase
VRAVVLRGAGGHFCAGGDITDMVAARSDPAPDGIATFNRMFGALLQAVEACPAAVIAVCEGAVMGGGFGLACAADITLAVEGARFRLPETGLGISPAQIAPFLVRRLGLSQARRLAVTGRTADASEAVRLGLAHARVEGVAAVDGWLEATLRDVLRCEPHAVAETKRVMLQAVHGDLDTVLWDAARGFQQLVEGPHAEQGFTAFLSRQPAPWVVEEIP